MSFIKGTSLAAVMVFMQMKAFPAVRNGFVDLMKSLFQ
jgi:hypothetical protein